MPGIDRKRLIDSHHMINEILCVICSAIFIDPLVTPCCGQTYCGDCLRDWLRQNNKCHSCRKGLIIDDLIRSRFTINVLNKLEFKCQFDINGCEQRLKYETLSKHTETCKYNPDANCGNCGDKNGVINAHNCIENLKKAKLSLEMLTKELFENIDNNLKESKKLSDELSQSREESRKYKLTINALSKEIIGLKCEKSEMEQKIISFNKCIAEEFSKQFGFIKQEAIQPERNHESNTEYLAFEVCSDSDYDNDDN